jgi:hypothetical protein
MHDGSFDPAKLQIDALMPASKAPEPRRRPRQFVMLPLAWKSRLGAARHACTLKVAIELQFRHWKSRGGPIRLANAAMAQIGVHRNSKWRALLELEGLGLIKIARRPRKSPEVTVLDLPEDDDAAQN